MPTRMNGFEFSTDVGATAKMEAKVTTPASSTGGTVVRGRPNSEWKCAGHPAKETELPLEHESYTSLLASSHRS